MTPPSPLPPPASMTNNPPTPPAPLPPPGQAQLPGHTVQQYQPAAEPQQQQVPVATPTPAPTVEATPPQPPPNEQTIVPTRVTEPAPNLPKPELFLPKAPHSIGASGLQAHQVEALVLKALNNAGASSSRQLSEQIKLPGDMIRNTLDELRNELLVVHKGTTDLVDYVFQLTEEGAERCKIYSSKTDYCGAAPVTLDAYIESVRAQAVAQKTLHLEDFRKALDGLFLTPEVQSQLAQAVNAGRGLFLYGLPGNGKTSVAERLMACYPDTIWIPRAIGIGGDVMRLFDPSVHVEVNPADFGIDIERTEIDRRWVMIQRPTVIVGGELTMDHLEIQFQPGANVLEAPVQLKSNGGTLVIDDFGRQRVSATDILNRWIVPLERREDFLNLPNGRQIQVPFLQTLVLATNLDPASLVDEAFLRRIPYKVEMPDPTDESFEAVFNGVASSMKMRVEPGAFEYLMEKYRASRVPMRYCHARDLLLQIDNLCDLHGLPRIVTPRTMDAVIRNYFGGQPGV